jgi:hypothetical protein
MHMTYFRPLFRWHMRTYHLHRQGTLVKGGNVAADSPWTCWRQHQRLGSMRDQVNQTYTLESEVQDQHDC